MAAATLTMRGVVSRIVRSVVTGVVREWWMRGEERQADRADGRAVRRRPHLTMRRKAIRAIGA